jgi:hypothetical protein
MIQAAIAKQTTSKTHSAIAQKGSRDRAMQQALSEPKITRAEVPSGHCQGAASDHVICIIMVSKGSRSGERGTDGIE